jgi:glycosyltransferase involved in cell wall biosynthesis
VTEVLTVPFIAHYTLAEKVYQSQLSFTKSKLEVIENKAVIPSELQRINRTDKAKRTFLYAGTIALHYGIFDAVNFIKELHALNNDVEFRIVGFAPDQNVLKQLRAVTANNDYIKLIGGNNLIAHNQILKEMAEAAYCLLPYQNNKSTHGRLPTKLFECLALEVPMIITPNETWNSIIAENNAGIIHNFQSANIPLKKIESGSYYGNNLSNNYLWNQEQSKIINIVDRLI